MGFFDKETKVVWFVRKIKTFDASFGDDTAIVGLAEVNIKDVCRRGRESKTGDHTPMIDSS